MAVECCGGLLLDVNCSWVCSSSLVDFAIRDGGTVVRLMSSRTALHGHSTMSLVHVAWLGIVGISSEVKCTTWHLLILLLRLLVVLLLWCAMVHLCDVT